MMFYMGFLSWGILVPGHNNVLLAPISSCMQRTASSHGALIDSLFARLVMGQVRTPSNILWESMTMFLSLSQGGKDGTE
jgi:hypothetical protein